MPRRSVLAAIALLVVACAAPPAGPALPIGAVANEPPALAGSGVHDESDGPGASLASAAEPAAPPADAAPGNAAPDDPAPAPDLRSAPALAPEPTATPDPAADPCQSPPAPGSFRAFRAPLPPVPVWNPPGPKRVGLQAGHWLTEEAPEELSRLQHGASGGGKQEWEVNLEIARRAAQLLEAAGVEVDVLPATVPPRYRAHAFISIHADGDPLGQARGFKIARPGFSSVPEADDQLVAALYSAYEAATGLERDDGHVTNRMRYYYAFNSRRYCHAVAPGVPQAIVETGFLTSAADRRILIGNPDLPAQGIAAGVLVFLERDAEP